MHGKKTRMIHTVHNIGNIQYGTAVSIYNSTLEAYYATQSMTPDNSCVRFAFDVH